MPQYGASSTSPPTVLLVSFTSGQPCVSWSHVRVGVRVRVRVGVRVPRPGPVFGGAVVIVKILLLQFIIAPTRRSNSSECVLSVLSSLMCVQYVCVCEGVRMSRAALCLFG